MDGARYLEDGRLTIFKRSGVFYARIRLSASGRYIWRSLKTTNEQTAIDLGRRLLFQLEQRVEQGLPPKSQLFSAVILSKGSWSVFVAAKAIFPILNGLRCGLLLEILLAKGSATIDIWAVPITCRNIPNAVAATSSSKIIFGSF
jgi:hypothetical protein